MGNFLASTFLYSGMFVYIAVTPFLFQKEMGISPSNYGLLGLFIAAGLVIGNLSGGKFVKKIGMDKPNYISSTLILLGSILMLILSFFNIMSIWVVMVPFAVYLVGQGITGVNCPANAMTPFAGIAGALWGGLQFFICSSWHQNSNPICEYAYWVGGDQCGVTDVGDAQEIRSEI